MSTVYLTEYCYDYKKCVVYGIFSTVEKAVASINEIDYGDERNVYRYEVDGDGTLIASAARGKEIRIPNDHHE